MFLSVAYQVFGRLDHDEDGLLSVEDVRRLVADRAQDTSDRKLLEMIHFMSLDGDTTTSREELTLALAKAAEPLRKWAIRKVR